MSLSRSTRTRATHDRINSVGNNITISYGFVITINY